jgi:hypothetical protein
VTWQPLSEIHPDVVRHRDLSERVGYLKACEHISIEAERLTWAAGVPFLFSILLSRRVRRMIRTAASRPERTE